MEDRIIEIIADVLGVDIADVTGDLAIGDIPSWDSLRHLTIIKTLAKEFDITIEQSQVAELEDVSDIISLMKELKGE